MSAEMKNTLVESKLLRDGYRCVKHASGLTVFIYPKAEMRSTYAVFGTRYGSIDKVFKRSDEDKAETATHSAAMPRSALPQTRIRRLRRRATCSPARKTQSRRWRFCSTSCSPRILQSRPLKKSSASSARKSKCMTMIRSGA